MELFTATHVALVTSILLSVFRLITCQDQVSTPAFVSVTEGETATIDCNFDQTNLIGLVWLRGHDVNNATALIRTFKGTKFIVPAVGPRFDLTTENSLVINGTSQADSGMYWCQVTLQGVFQSSTNLTVLPVTTTPQKETSIITVKPTKAEPKKQSSNNTTLYIIVGSCAGVVSLAILVLVCYCCCCKKKSPDGYSKPNPNTPV